MKRSVVLVGSLVLGLSLLVSGCSTNNTSSPSSTPAAGGSTSSTASQPAIEQSAAVPTQQPVPPEKNPPGDIPDNQAFVLYSAAGGFSVKVPEGWSRQESAASVEFTDKLNTIRVAWTAGTAAPTAQSVTSEDIPKLKASEAAFELRSVKAVSLPAGPAVLVVYRENSAPNAVTGKQYRLDVERYTLFRNGKRVDLTLLSPVGADNVDPWRIVSRSLTWK